MLEVPLSTSAPKEISTVRRPPGMKINVHTREKEVIEKMAELEIILYDKMNFLPKLFFLQPRVKTKELTIPKSIYKDRKKVLEDQLESLCNLISNKNNCRYLIIANYFNERLDKRCGKCDHCVNRNRLSKNEIFQKLPLSFQDVNELEEDHKGTRIYIRRLISEGVLKIEAELIVK